MACNSVDGDQAYWIKELLKVAGHIHIADAIGEDGEGVNFGDGELDTSFNGLNDHIFLDNGTFNIQLIIQDNSNERLASGKARFPGFMTPLALLCFIGEVVGQRVRRIAPTR